MSSNGTTPLKANIIQVGVILFPDGTNHYFKILPISQINKNQIYVEKKMGEWFKKKKLRYKLQGVDLESLSTVFANIKMLEADFDKITTIKQTKEI